MRSRLSRHPDRLRSFSRQIIPCLINVPNARAKTVTHSKTLEAARMVKAANSYSYTLQEKSLLIIQIRKQKCSSRKHSYPCRFHAVGKCLSGDNCKFQHGDKPGAVFSMIGAEPEEKQMDLDASIQDTYSRFPSELVMLRPKRKVVTNMDDDDDD